MSIAGMAHRTTLVAAAMLLSFVCSATSAADRSREEAPVPAQKRVEKLPDRIDVPAATVGAMKTLSAPEWTVPGLDLLMKRIPAGSFTMGSPPDEPTRRDDETQHKVTVSRPFYMAAYEVTQKQFYDLMMPDYDFESWTYFRGPIGDGGAFHIRRRPNRIMTANGFELLLDNPMECVSWPRALEFCEAINAREAGAGRLPEGYEYRLPSEAEWEYACRAGSESMFNVDLDIETVVAEEEASRTSGHKELRRIAYVNPKNPNWGGGAGTGPVGGKRQPNAWGLYDMHGNVAEWCLDTYAPYPRARKSVDPVAFGPGREKTIRGGAYTAGYPFLRSARRYSVPFEAEYLAFVGIRLVLAPAIDVPAPELPEGEADKVE